jgi:hypothetical protein
MNRIPTKQVLSIFTVQMLVIMPSLAPLFRLLDELEQRSWIAPFAVNFRLERSFSQPLPVLGSNLDIEAHRAVESAGVEVVQFGSVVAYAVGFLLTGLLESLGFCVDGHEDFAESFNDRFAKRGDG